MLMVLTAKQSAAIRLARSGRGPTEIARETGLHRVSVSKLLSRAKKRLRAAGLDPDKLIDGDMCNVMELMR